MFKDKIEKANILVEALPYIKKFHNRQVVVKYGGSLMIDKELQKKFATDIVLLKYVGMNPIIVHGGGKEISRWMEKVGKKAVFIDGLRFTDDETMELTEMVLSGKINSQLVSLINQSGGKAVGLSGKDGGLFTAKKIRSKEDKDLGLVGKMDSCNVSIVQTLNKEGYIPVVSCVGVGEDGESLNMNADNVAAGLAKSLNAMKLLYLTDVQGILCEDKLLNTLSLNEAEELTKHEDIKGGMIPKLECSIDALKNGVENVHIINGTIEHSVLLEIFTDTGIGTMISNEFS